MNPVLRPRHCVLALALTTLVLAFGPTAAPAAQPKILVRGNGVAVTQEQLDEAYLNLVATLAAQGRPTPDTLQATLERQLLEKLALTQLLLKRATPEERQRGIEKANKLLAEQKARARSEARFEAQILAAGLSPEKFTEQLQERAICEEVLDRDLDSTLGITPEKVRDFYDQHPADFRRSERVRLRQVVITLRGVKSPAEQADRKALAQRLHDRAAKGEDLEKLARDYSDDPDGRDRGGEYIFPVGQMVPELELAVRLAPTNRVADLVTTPYGFHIFRIEERMPAEPVPFEEVKDPIRVRLELEAKQEALPKYQERLFQEAKVEFVTPP